MAAVLHALDQRRLIDSNGIADGAEIYFYQTGTLTKISIYSDAALSVPLTNPVVVASGAAVPSIYWDSSYISVRRRIVYADGSVDDTDPYIPASAATIPTGAPGILTSVEDVLEHVNAASFFGIPESGSTAGETAQTVIDELSALAADAGIDKGAVLRLKPFGAYDWEVGESSAYKEGIKLRPGVSIDLQGARMNRRCHSDNERGFILMTGSGLRNGRINAISEFVSVGGSALGTSAGIHGPVGIGSIYGEGGTPAARSELDGAYGWAIENLTLTADKWLNTGAAMVGAALIQLYGDCHTGVISNIMMPSSANAFIGVAADWNFASTDSFESGSPANYATYRTQWDAGTLRTYHPSNIVIDRINAGNFTAAVDADMPNDTGSFLIRLSGCQGIQVSNVWGGTFTNAFVSLFAGDVGFEFATDHARKLGMDGSTLRNINGIASQHGYLAYLESYADNLADAIEDHGYDAYTKALIYARLVIDGLRGFSERGALAQDGVRALRLWGADIVNSVAVGFKNNFLVDEKSKAVKIHDGKAELAQQSNIYIGHGSFPPEDCEVGRMEVALANRGGGTGYGVFVGNHRNTKVHENTFGVEDAFDDSTTVNVRVDSGTGLQGWGNKHRSTSADGVAESIGTADDYAMVDRWEIGEMDPDFVFTEYGGVTILPEARRTDPDGVRRGQFRAQRSALSGDINPTAGTWLKGDRIDYREADAGAFTGVFCTTSGTNGTLSGVTGGISSGSNLLTVNTAADLEVGQYITIAGVSGVKRITALSGTNVTLDSNADATVAGAAVAYSPAVFKRFGAVEA